MRGDLGAGGGEVHAAACNVLAFWFEETPADKRFAKDTALDRAIALRFGALRDQVLATDAVCWDQHPETLLAAIILLDQFSRNIHRGAAEAFSADRLALRLTHLALERGWDGAMPVERRAFLYMPLMHAEDHAEQGLSVACFERLGVSETLDFAIAHAAVIESFGRFPARNAALGRPSTPAEHAYINRPGAGW